MNKEFTENKLRPSRKNLFTKTIKLNKIVDDIKLPMIKFTQAKTVRRFKNHNIQIPFLNLKNLPKDTTQEIDTLHFKQTKLISSSRGKLTSSTNENSFTQKKTFKIRKISSQQHKTQVIQNKSQIYNFRDIINDSKTKEYSFKNLEKKIKTDRTNIYSNLKKSRVQCKILLSKKSSFPFHIKSKSQSKRDKNQSSQICLDQLNISQIFINDNDQKFMAQDSIYQLPIF